MNLGMTRRARMILLGSVLLLLSISSFTILRGLSSSSPSIPVSRLMPALSYGEVNGDSEVNASIVLGGCVQLASWGTPVQSGNEFSVTASAVDISGPGIACPAFVFVSEHTYEFGQLAPGNYSFTLTACTNFPQ